MKYLFVLGLFAVVAFFFYWRLRPYIRGVRRFLGVVREMNRVRAGAAPQSDIPRTQSDIPRRKQPVSAPNERLVRCAACGTWMPASRAVSLRAGTTYCSHSCLERAADSPQKARKNAS
ncbi:MAG: hypothetical protein QOH51_2631 [Acidobacteriota bacterium]|nr:hypothetical protein [Acidobacteriota bacterium]